MAVFVVSTGSDLRGHKRVGHDASPTLATGVHRTGLWWLGIVPNDALSVSAGTPLERSSSRGDSVAVWRSTYESSLPLCGRAWPHWTGESVF